MKKNEKWLIGAVTGVAAAATAIVVYKLLSKDIPDGAVAVEPFDMKRYLGQWNEIARLPNSFEKHIQDLTEHYGFGDDEDTFTVITKGYNYKKEKWTTVNGTIKYAGKPDVGKLKVSYFGPFYANYNILALDENYQYAMVSGSGLSYLWLLSRETTMPDDVKIRFLKIANEIGFEIGELEWM